MSASELVLEQLYVILSPDAALRDYVAPLRPEVVAEEALFHP